MSQKNQNFFIQKLFNCGKYTKLQDIKFLRNPKLIENFIFPFISIQANEQYNFLNININISVHIIHSQ